MLLLLAIALALPAMGDPAVVAETTAPDAPERPVRAWVRPSLHPPTLAELDRLAHLTRSAPLWGALPPDAPGLGAFPPPRPVAGRNAALDWRIAGGEPGDTIFVRLLDAGGTLDSASIVLDGHGAAEGAFRVRPERSGWQSWRVETAGRMASAGAWAAPPEPLDVLIAAGPGSVEAREVARALERAGARVTPATDLGRGLRLGNAPADIPDLTALRAYDVVVVLAGFPLSQRDGNALRSYVTGGGGLLAAGGAAALLGANAGPTTSVSGAALRWVAPAAIEPLPPTGTAVAIAPLTDPPSLHPAARAADATVLALGADGRGRLAALGILDTWRWTLDAGRTAEHAAFWNSLAAWLAGGSPRPFAVNVVPATGPPGIPVDIHIARLDTLAVPPTHLHIVRTDGSVDSLPVAWSGDEGAARFLAVDSGSVPILLPGDTLPLTGHLADPAADPAPDAWARLSEIAHASGGRLVPADSLDAAGGDATSRFPLRVLLVGLCALVACADWAARRLHGKA